MKLNEFKDIEEGFFGDLGSKIKGALADPQTKLSNKTQGIFMKNFVANAANALNTGIKSGLITPGAAGGVGGNTVNPNSVKPDQGQPGAAGAANVGQAGASAASKPKPDTSNAVGKYNQQVQQTQNMNQYVQGAAKAINSTQDKNQKMALTKELVNYMADRKGYPEWDNGVATVQQIIKKGNPDPNFANGAINRLRAGQTMSEAWRIYYINKLLEAVGITWKELGLSVLKEGKTYYIAETKYLKLNNIFESMLTEGKTVGQYMMQWFNNFMGKIDWSEEADDVKNAINALDKAIAQDGNKVGKNAQAALTSLAGIAYAVQQSGGKIGGGSSSETKPKAGAEQGAQGQGAEGQGANSQTASAPAAGAGQANSFQMASQIKKQLQQLSQLDIEAYNQLVKSLQLAKAPNTEPPKVAAGNQATNNPQAQAEPKAQNLRVSEAKRKVRKAV
jgi:hypothetical protein